MSNKEFINKAKELVRNYTIEHMDETEWTNDLCFDVFVVWNCFILGNIKAMLATTNFDGMYYEVTYNKANNEIYFDAYKKFEHRKVELND